MSEIIDRRANGRRKSAGNQQRFLKRYKAQIREAVARAVSQRKIADTAQGGNVTIPARDLVEGLPVGVQLVGRRWEDHRLLDIASLLEAHGAAWRMPPAAGG